MFRRLSRGERSLVGSTLGLGGGWLAIGVYRLITQDGMSAILSPGLFVVLLACALGLAIATFLLRKLGERGGHTIAAGVLLVPVCYLLIPEVVDALLYPGPVRTRPVYASMGELVLGMGSLWLSLTILLRWVRWQE